MIEKAQPHYHPDHQQREADGAGYQHDDGPGVLELVIRRKAERVHHHQQQEDHRRFAPVQQHPALVETQPLEKVYFQRRAYHHYANERDEEKEDERVKTNGVLENNDEVRNRQNQRRQGRTHLRYCQELV